VSFQLFDFQLCRLLLLQLTCQWQMKVCKQAKKSFVEVDCAGSVQKGVNVTKKL
jgi:hypothetical protein